MLKIFRHGESAKTRACIVVRRDTTPYNGYIYILRPWHVDRMPNRKELDSGDFELQGYHLLPGRNPIFRLTKESPKLEIYDMPFQLWLYIQAKSNEYKQAILSAHVEFMQGYNLCDTVWE